MSKKPASLTSDLLARKGEAEPSTIDPTARMTLSAGPGFSSYGDDGHGEGGHGEGERGEEGQAESARPIPPEPEIIYTAEETSGGGSSTRLIIGAVLGLIAVGGIFLSMSGKSERGVAPVSPDIVAQAPAEAPVTTPAEPSTSAPDTSAMVPPAVDEDITEAPTSQDANVPSLPLAEPAPADHASVDHAPADLRPGAETAQLPQAAAPVEPAAPAVEVPAAPVEAAKPVQSAAPAQKPAAAVKASSKGAYVVQLLALKDEAAARASWAQLTKRHSSVLAGHALDIEKADLGAKGTWYRVRAAGFTTKAAAASACTKLKAAGQDCMAKKR